MFFVSLRVVDTVGVVVSVCIVGDAISEVVVVVDIVDVVDAFLRFSVRNGIFLCRLCVVAFYETY